MKTVAATATITPGEITFHDEQPGRSYTVRHMGTVNKGRTTYQLQEATSISDEFGTNTEMQLVGPRGALYFLISTARPGVYFLRSLMGTEMRTGGNRVHITVIGDLVEFSR